MSVWSTKTEPRGPLTLEEMEHGFAKLFDVPCPVTACRFCHQKKLREDLGAKE